MRFYLDECLSPKVLEPLRSVFKTHDFLDYMTEGLKGTKDVPLLREIATRDVDVFITVDRAQLTVPDEVRAIKAGSCHWVGLRQATGGGLSKLARTGATLLETVAFISDNAPSAPTAFRPKASGREHHQLFSEVVPISSL
ncbi:hypothetical protein ACEYYH_15385 [Microbacterium trichothecenolyticum]|uniref:PIN-like domain-containing protein n=1 Tax=Microbacterium trichothecenolyticum TaxID=69370 RepID=UPI0035BE6C60